MLKTRQPSIISKTWKNINQSWGIAIGFLMLLFIVPFAIIVSDPTRQNLTNSNASASKPLVLISPQKGQGTKAQFVAEVRDVDVSKLETVDLWFGEKPYNVNQPSGNYATVSFKNFAVGTGADWRANVYRTENGQTVNITSLLPDDNADSNLSKIYATPSKDNSNILLSTTDSDSANSVVKFRNFEKLSATTLRFYVDVEFKSNFSDTSINTYMKSQRGIVYGGETSSLNGNEWTNVGTWTVGSSSPKASYSCTTTPLKFTSSPVTTATVGTQYQYVVVAKDDNDDPFTFSITSANPPAFLAFRGKDIYSATLSGTPSASDAGSKHIEITATDVSGCTAVQAWDLNVQGTATPVPTTVPLTTVAPTTNTANIQSPRISRRTPEESVITDTKPTISAIITAGSADADLSTLVVTLDDNDVTSQIDKGVDSFSYKPLTDLSYAVHTVKVIVKGKDAVDDKGVLNESWTFTVSQNLPGSTNESTTTTVNKIKLPLIGITVDQWLGTVIIGLFVILLFGILVIAVIALIRTLKGKDDDIEHITKYYNQDKTPPTLGSSLPTVTPGPTIDTLPAESLTMGGNTLTPNEPKPEISDPFTSNPVPMQPVAQVVEPMPVVAPVLTPVEPAPVYSQPANDPFSAPVEPSTPVLDVTSTENLTDLNSQIKLSPEEEEMVKKYDVMGGTKSQTFNNPVNTGTAAPTPNDLTSKEPYDPFRS